MFTLIRIALASILLISTVSLAQEVDPFKPTEKQVARLKQEPKGWQDKKLRTYIETCESLVGTLDKTDPVVLKKLPRLREKIGWLYREYSAVNPKDYRKPNHDFKKAAQWIVEYDLIRALKILQTKKDPEMVRRGKQPSGAYLDISSRSGHLASWDLHIPKGYDPNKKHPLLICFQTGMSTQACSDQGYFLIQSFQSGPPASSIHYSFMLSHMVNDTAKDFNIDRDRIFVTGFSTGGATCFVYAYRYSDLVAAAAPVCPAKEWRDGPTRHAHNFAVNVMYGKGDSWTKVGALPILERLKASKHPNFESYPYDAGHDASPVLKTDTKPLFDFFNKQKRDPYPKKVWKWVEHKRWSSAYWMNIKLRQDGKVQGSVVGEIKDGNVVELTTSEHVAAVALYLNDKLVDMSKPVKVTANGKELYNGEIKPELYVEILKDHKPYWQDKAAAGINPYWIKARKWPGPGESLEKPRWIK